MVASLGIDKDPQSQYDIMMDFLRGDSFGVPEKNVAAELKANGLETYITKPLPDGGRISLQLPSKEKRGSFSIGERMTQRITDSQGKSHEMPVLARLWHIDSQKKVGKEYLFLENGSVIMADVADPTDEKPPVRRWNSENWQVLSTKPNSFDMVGPFAEFETSTRPKDMSFLKPDYNQKNSSSISELMGHLKTFGMEG